MNIMRNDMFHIKRRLSSSMTMNLGASNGRRTERGICKVNKKRAAFLRLLYFRRCLADSNRRRRFCRP